MDSPDATPAPAPNIAAPPAPVAACEAALAAPAAPASNAICLAFIVGLHSLPHGSRAAAMAAPARVWVILSICIFGMVLNYQAQRNRYC